MSLPHVTTPRTDGGSYIIDRMDGETFTMPGCKGSFRMYATQLQTGNAMSVFGWDGPASDQSYHHHLKTHDCFLIAEGTMKVYCDGESRILGPGDFASVPPGLVHKPTPLGPITKAIPLITPADWVNAFRDCSEPFDGIMFPEWDNQPQSKAVAKLGPNFMEDYDSYPDTVENPPEPKPWSDADSKLPNGQVGYFLACNTGPRWALGGVTSRPFITTKQSHLGKFAISSIEASSVHGSSVFDRLLTFPKVHHCFVLFDGIVEFTIGRQPSRAIAGEVVFIAANTPFSMKFFSKYVRFWSYASGNGLEALISEAGTPIEGAALPDKALPVDEQKILDVCHKLDIKV